MPCTRSASVWRRPCIRRHVFYIAHRQNFQQFLKVFLYFVTTRRVNLWSWSHIGNKKKWKWTIITSIGCIKRRRRRHKRLGLRHKRAVTSEPFRKVMIVMRSIRRLRQKTSKWSEIVIGQSFKKSLKFKSFKKAEKWQSFKNSIISFSSSWKCLHRIVQIFF